MAQYSLTFLLVRIAYVAPIYLADGNNFSAKPVNLCLIRKLPDCKKTIT